MITLINKLLTFIITYICKETDLSLKRIKVNLKAQVNEDDKIKDKSNKLKT